MWRWRQQLLEDVEVLVAPDGGCGRGILRIVREDGGEEDGGF